MNKKALQELLKLAKEAERIASNIFIVEQGTPESACRLRYAEQALEAAIALCTIHGVEVK